MTDQYAVWREELRNPSPMERRGDRPTEPNLLGGFWRIEGAKTRADFPVAIWTENGKSETIFQIGRKVMNTAEHQTEWQEFTEGTWVKCHAVSKADWNAALDTGFWSDGKPAKRMSDEEKLGIDVSPGDNAAPVSETIAEQIAALVEKANGLKVTNADEARIANETAEKLNVLFKLGDAERVKAKAPFDEGAKAVQALWLPIITPATDARERLVGKDGAVKKWLKAEQAKADAIAAEERRKAQEAADAENKRIRAENQRRLDEARDAGGELLPEELTPEVAAAPVEAPKVQAASTFGRATGLRKVKRGKITDAQAFAAALVRMGHKDLMDLLQTLADRAAKAGMPVEGVEIIEELQ